MPFNEETRTALGVIIGDDLVYDAASDQLRGNIEATKDPTLRRHRDNFEMHVKNIYRTLLMQLMRYRARTRRTFANPCKIIAKVVLDIGHAETTQIFSEQKDVVRSRPNFRTS